MTAPMNPDKTQKPRMRNTRFTIYAIILLALGALLYYEDGVNVTINVIEMKLKQQKIDAARQRNTAAYALVTKAAATNDSAEQMSLYDEIINTYLDDEAASVAPVVSWAQYKKAQLITDPLEKSRLFEEVVDRYCDVPDRQVARYVTAALHEMLDLPENRTNKAAFCDRILEKQGHRLTDSLAAWLLTQKAEATPDRAEKIAIYDAILARFLSSADDSAFSAAVTAAMEKMTMVTGKDEQIRLCDIAIDAYLKTPQRTHYYHFDEAIRKKAELVGDPALPLALYNQVIVNNKTEESVVQARSLRLPFLKNDEERMAACDEFIAVHQASKSDFVQLMVARAMERKADLLTDTEAKAALYRSIVEKCENIDDSRAKDLANQTTAKLATLSGDAASAARYYDEKATNAKNELEALRALRSKAENIVKDKAEKIRIYDEIIARGVNSQDDRVSREVIDVIRQKIWLIDDREERIALYNEAITRSKESRYARERANVASLMLGKAKILDDKEAKISLYDEIIASSASSGNERALSLMAEAMHEKAKIIDNKEEKIKLYDTVLFDMVQIHDNMFFPRIRSILQERAALAAEAHEKLQLYDNYIAAASEIVKPEARIPILFDKIEVTTDPAGKSQLYDEIIEYCKQSLSAEEGDERMKAFVEYKKRLALDNLGEAILGKADLTDSVEEKLELYDWYLTFPQMADFDVMDINFEKVVTRKAELTGDPLVKSYYFDAKMKAATTDLERVQWSVRKAAAAGKTDSAEIDEEIITKFFDSTEAGVESLVAGALLNKIMKTSDENEKNILCDRLITRYQDSTDDRALSAVIQALTFKAGAAEDDEAKLEIYSAIIDRYKNIDDFFVKKRVDDAIAAKYRLERKKKEK